MTLPPLPKPKAWLQTGIGICESPPTARVRPPRKYNPEWWKFDELFTTDQLRAYAEAAVAAEREACAKIAAQEHAACWHATAMGGAQAAARIVDAIRSRT